MPKSRRMETLLSQESTTLKSEEPDKKKAKRITTELNLYFKSYKNGLNDFHWPIFRASKEIVKPNKVLYPGCHRHITASLIFSDVVYVDNDSKLKACYSDPKVLEWLEQNKEYSEETRILLKCENFEHDFGEKNESFDLVMSLCAGIVTSSCSKYLKTGGYFFVSDAHYDARLLNLNKNFQLTHLWDGEKFTDSKESLEGHFVTKDGQALTKEMVQESIDKPKARRSFKLQKEAMFYLFRKLRSKFSDLYQQGTTSPDKPFNLCLTDQITTYFSPSLRVSHNLEESLIDAELVEESEGDGNIFEMLDQCFV